MKTFSVTNYRVHFIVAIIAILGLALIVIGQTDLVWRNISVGSVLANIGATILLVAALQFIYDHYVRKYFFEDISKTIIKNQSIRDSGLIEFYEDSIKIDYSSYITSSNTMRMLILYSTRICKDNFDDLKERSGDEKPTEIFALAPSGNAVDYLKSLGWVEDETVATHRRELEEIANDLPLNNLTIIDYDYLPKYTAVVFDNDIFLVFNTTSKGRTKVPAMHIRRPSPMYDFIMKDIDKLGKQTNES